MRGILRRKRLVVCSISVLLLSCLACWGGAAAQSATLVQQVNQAPAPPIMWNAPEAIPFGTPLSAVQLNATSAAAGSFVYQPANGTMLAPGTNTLSVVFSPLDPNFQAGSASVPIVVTPPGSSSFSVKPLSAGSPESALILEPGVAATIQLAVGPVGDFHQPVTLSCSVRLFGRKCSISPAVVRPTTNTVQVALTLAPEDGPSSTRSSMSRLPPITSTSKRLMPGVASAALFGVFFFRRRLQWLAVLPTLAITLLVLPLLVMLSGCGFEGYYPVKVVEVRASSLVESRLSQIYVVDDEARSPWLDRRVQPKGAAR